MTTVCVAIYPFKTTLAANSLILSQTFISSVTKDDFTTQKVRRTQQSFCMGCFYKVHNNLK